jgi:hypothetical protein
VLLNLLDRLESSALFSEESCSFSQKDLLDNLQVWVDKARGQWCLSTRVYHPAPCAPCCSPS